MPSSGMPSAIVSTMVDSREDGTMAQGQELELRIGRVEERLEELGHSVDAGFLEQREYTEFAFDRLRTEMVSRFDNVDKRFDRMDARFDRLERKLDQFIDTQSRTNMLVERRLQGLEPPPPPN